MEMADNYNINNIVCNLWGGINNEKIYIQAYPLNDTSPFSQSPDSFRSLKRHE